MSAKNLPAEINSLSHHLADHDLTGPVDFRFAVPEAGVLNTRFARTFYSLADYVGTFGLALDAMTDANNFRVIFRIYRTSPYEQSAHYRIHAKRPAQLDCPVELEVLPDESPRRLPPRRSE